MTQVEFLMSVIATDLSGREVVARVRPLTGAGGRIERRGGQLHMGIKPENTRRSALEIYLHELSHCLHDAGLLVDLDDPADAATAVEWADFVDEIEERATRDSKLWARRVRRHVPEKHGLAKQLAWLLANKEVIK